MASSVLSVMSGYRPQRSNGSYGPPVFNGGKIQHFQCHAGRYRAHPANKFFITEFIDMDNRKKALHLPRDHTVGILSVLNSRESLKIFNQNAMINSC